MNNINHLLRQSRTLLCRRIISNVRVSIYRSWHFSPRYIIT